MKKEYTKPSMKIIPCNVRNIQGDVRVLSESELKKQLQENGIKEKAYYAKNTYILREIAGESILVSVGGGVADFCGIVSLNPAAKIIWTALQRGVTKGDLIQILIDQFSISKDRAADDVNHTLNLLEERGLIVSA